MIVVLFVVGSVQCQTVNIPDLGFKSKLLEADTWNDIARNLEGNSSKVDLNNNGIIEVSEALNIKQLNIGGANINTLTGINYFTNLEYLDCSSNNIVALNVSQLTNLEFLHCFSSNIVTLNVAGLYNLKYLNCSQNSLSALDLDGVTSLEHLNCANNNLSVLELGELTALTNLLCEANYLSVLDVSNSSNLFELICSQNDLTLLNIDGITTLDYLDCSYNNLTTLNTFSLYTIQTLHCHQNMLTELNVSNSSLLLGLVCDNNHLTQLDLENTKVHYLTCQANDIEYLNIKNGEDLVYYSTIYNPLLKYICLDESEYEIVTAVVYENLQSLVINSYCSFTPGGDFYTINGTNMIDANNDGCNASDVSMPNLKFNFTNGIQSGSLLSNQLGEYSIPVAEGTHTITPILENPTFFNVSPSTVSVTFPETTSPFTQNFCITPNGIHPDLEVAILPTTPARPGFDANYKLIIKNKGNTLQSGSVSFNYYDAVLDYIIANPVFTTQAEGSLTWDFANLEPFETREFDIVLNVNSPMETPAVNGDDVLNYTATITSDQADELPLDNTFTLPQIVVNSFDPNDKTCLEGTSITPNMIGKYVHYMIRFENTGTFAAENIVVKDMIDTAKFDVSSLVALNGSHPYTTRITGNKVEFIFENINIPFDDANNDGYVVFKVKTLPTLVLGDTFSNSASIYFDYNFPIVTDPAVTTFAVLGNEDFEFNNYFTLYPNPTNGILNITSKQAIEMQTITIYNALGQKVVAVPNAKGISSVDVSSLAPGNYFIKIVSDKGTSNTKFIKQ